MAQVGAGRYDKQVRTELERMSPATIDRYLVPAPGGGPDPGKASYPARELVAERVCQLFESLQAHPMSYARTRSAIV